MSNLKVEGKVVDFCPKCKNCKSTTRECDGEKDWLTEVKCEDPYDGMIKTLAADSDICCSMFEAKTGEKNNAKGIQECCCENIHFMPSQVNAMIDDVKRQKDIERNAAVNGLKIQIKQLELGYEELECKIKDLTDTNIKLMERNVELVAQCDEVYEKFKNYEKILNDILDIVYEHPEMFERNMAAYELLPGRVKTLKHSWDMMCDKYDPLNVENEQRKKAMDNQAKILDERNSKIKAIKEEIKRLQSNIDFQKYLKDETYKREDELKKELKKVKAHDEAITKHFQNDEKLIDNIQKVIFPQEEGSDYAYSYEEILNKVKELKVQSDENGAMYEEIKELRAKNQAYFNEISDRLAKHTDQCDEISKLKDAIDKIAYVMYGRHKPQKYDYEKLANDISMMHKSLDNARERNKQIEELKVQSDEITKLKNENTSLNTINKGLAEDRQKLINYMRSLKIASDNYLKEFTYGEESSNE